MQASEILKGPEGAASKTSDGATGIVIEMQHVKKAFGANVVLADVSMKLKKGENLVVLGRSGSGKSVAIKCIVRLLDTDGGSLKVFGREVQDLSDDELKELRVRVGFLFQSGALYDSMTVGENLAFPLLRVLKLKDTAEVEKRVADVLTSVGLLDAIDKMPSDLSGGMRKRIGLARTLILNPEIILYDEPTTGLDPITSQEISELMLSLQKKYQTSAIIITHDMACAKITADRILVLDEGKFVAEGSYDELQNSPDESVRAFFK